MDSGSNVKVRARRLPGGLFRDPGPLLAACVLISVSLSWGLGLGRAAPVDLPSVNADLGPCTADFTVVSGAREPLYNARVGVAIKYGFLGLRKMSLEVGTNSDGKARVEGLPSKVRKHPLGFVVRSDGEVKTIEHYPAVNCNARYEVVLEKYQTARTDSAQPCVDLRCP